MTSTSRLGLAFLPFLVVGAACAAACSGDDAFHLPVSDAGSTSVTDATVGDSSVTTDANAGDDASLLQDSGEDASEDAAFDAASTVDAGPIPVVACGVQDAGADADAAAITDAAVDGDVCALPSSTCVDTAHVVSYTGGVCGDAGLCEFEQIVTTCPAGNFCVNGACVQGNLGR